MKEYASDTIRNVAFVGHGDCGKTTLVDAFLVTAGDISRIGSVEAGNTVSDFNDEEKERQITINTSFIFTEYNGMKINILDTPGFADFLAEVKGALTVVETAVVIMKADAGLEVGTEQVWRYAKEAGVPRILLVNKLDKEHTDFDAIIQTAVDRFGTGVAPLQFPLNPGPDFTTVIDLLKNKALVFEKDGKGSYTETDIPDEAVERAAALRETLMEAAAEADDTLMEKYFENGDLSPEDIVTGLLKGIREGTVHPLLCCSAQSNVGTGRVMELITQMVPAPGDKGELTGTDPKGEEVSRARSDAEPFYGQVFKTLSEAHVGELSFLRVYGGTLAQGMDVINTSRNSKERIGSLSIMKGHNRVEIDTIHAGDLVALVKLKNTHTGDTLCAPSSQFICPAIPFPDPVIRVAIEAKGKGDETKLSTGLQKLCEEDPSVSVVADPELAQTLLFGQGEVQLEVVAKKLQARFSVEIDMHEPKVKYRETITKPSEAHARHKKQTGGRGQFADVRIRMEPKPRGDGYEFENKIVGGSIPGRFIPSVDKGVTSASARGALAGYLCVDFKVSLYDGTFHDVDSSDAAFQRAASMAFKQAWKDAGPILLEPIYIVEVTVPDDFTGDIMADISGRRGKVEGVTSEGPFQVIRAKIPLAELFKYSTTLRSMTQGRATHHREFSHYDPMPHDVTQRVIAQADLEEEEED
ncbi:elongation factor G [Candidatus Zixiibacteriota bacterium]